MTWFRGRVCYGYRCPFWVRSGRPASLLIGVIETGKRPEVGYLFARGLDGALLRRPSRPRSSVLIFTAGFDVSPESRVGDIWALDANSFPVRRPKLLQVLRIIRLICCARSLSTICYSHAGPRAGWKRHDRSEGNSQPLKTPAKRV